MKYFRGELINRQMYEDAFEQSNTFWFLKQYELKGRYGLYYTYYSDGSLTCDTLATFPVLTGTSLLYPISYPRTIQINVHDYRIDTIEDFEKTDFAFSNQKDLIDAAMVLKLQGHNVNLHNQIG